MITTEIIDRILSELPATFGLVEGAAELAALKGSPLATPAAYVWLDAEAAAENERATGVLQRVEADVSVLLVVDDVSDPRGAAAAGGLEAIKREIRRILVGWQPASADDVVTFGEARIVRIRDGAVWCEMTFATAYYLEA